MTNSFLISPAGVSHGGNFHLFHSCLKFNGTALVGLTNGPLNSGVERWVGPGGQGSIHPLVVFLPTLLTGPDHLGNRGHRWPPKLDYNLSATRSNLSLAQLGILNFPVLLRKWKIGSYPQVGLGVILYVEYNVHQVGKNGKNVYK